MTTLNRSAVTATLRHAVLRATRAASVHNTQPWRFIIRTDGTLELWADRTRHLKVMDPMQRQLVISCGCALFNARVALAAEGYDAVVERVPDRKQPDLLARISLPAQKSEWVAIGDLLPEIDRRQTNRRRYEDELPEPRIIDELLTAASKEGAVVFEVKEEAHRVALAMLSQQADAEENANQAYRAEIRQWTSDDPKRTDGVPAMAVPRVDGTSQDDIPIRDFDTRGMGWLPSKTQSSTRQCLLLIGMPGDNVEAWIRAGEALEHMWLVATKYDLVASPLTQIVEIPRTRQALREDLGLTMHPDILMRVGRAPQTPTSRRRPVDEVLRVEE